MFGSFALCNVWAYGVGFWCGFRASGLELWRGECLEPKPISKAGPRQVVATGFLEALDQSMMFPSSRSGVTVSDLSV